MASGPEIIPSEYGFGCIIVGPPDRPEPPRPKPGENLISIEDVEKMFRSREMFQWMFNAKLLGTISDTVPDGLGRGRKFYLNRHEVEKGKQFVKDLAAAIR